MWRLVLCGAGFGVFASPNNRLMMNAVPRERSGSAGGIIATARTLGQTMGAALVALVFGLFDFSGGGAADAARAAIWLGAGFAGAALVIGSLRTAALRDDRTGQARRRRRASSPAWSSATSSACGRTWAAGSMISGISSPPRPSCRTGC